MNKKPNGEQFMKRNAADSRRKEIGRLQTKREGRLSSNSFQKKPEQ